MPDKLRKRLSQKSLFLKKLMLHRNCPACDTARAHCHTREACPREGGGRVSSLLVLDSCPHLNEGRPFAGMTAEQLRYTERSERSALQRSRRIVIPHAALRRSRTTLQRRQERAQPLQPPRATADADARQAVPGRMVLQRSRNWPDSSHGCSR